MDRQVTITVHVCREDAPALSYPITISYFYHQSQSHWRTFIQAIKEVLTIDSVYLILNRLDQLPVFTILQLRDAAAYMVRPSESSCLIESLATDYKPTIESWPLISQIGEIQSFLNSADAQYPSTERKVTALLTRPQKHSDETLLTTRILQCTTLPQLQGLIKSLPEDKDKVLDMVSLHRLVMEAIERLLAVSEGAPLDWCFTYIRSTCQSYIQESDVVVYGLKLLGEICGLLPESLAAEVLHFMMETTQTFAPPSPPHRPRVIKRLAMNSDTEMMFGVLVNKKTGKVIAEGETIAPAAAMLEAPIELPSKPQVLDIEESPATAVEVVVAPVPLVKKGWSRTKGDTLNVKRAEVLMQETVHEEKLVLKPTPKGAASKFRVFQGRQAREVVLQQCLITLYRVIRSGDHFKQLGFDLFIMEEVADIAVNCVDAPIHLEYSLWIVHGLLEHVVRTPSQASLSILTDFVSNTLLLADLDETQRTIKKSLASALYKPNDHMVLFMAVVLGHSEMSLREKQLARRWVTDWNDDTKHFKRLVRKGLNLSGN